MEKLRFLNKDSRYFRNLLYKNEFRQSIFSNDLKAMKSVQNRLENSSNQLHTKVIEVNKTLYKVYIILLLQTLFNVCICIYYIKDLEITFEYHDYTNKMFYLWEGYREQIRSLYEFFKIWKIRM